MVEIIGRHAETRNDGFVAVHRQREWIDGTGHCSGPTDEIVTGIGGGGEGDGRAQHIIGGKRIHIHNAIGRENGQPWFERVTVGGISSLEVFIQVGHSITIKVANGRLCQ